VAKLNNITARVASGFLATGKADGSLTGGKGFGSPGTGDIAGRTKGIELTAIPFVETSGD